MSVAVLTTQERDRRNYVFRATQPGNRTLNRRTQPNARAIVHRLGYATACASLSSDTSIDRLSGSSLNRAYSKLKRDEKTQELREMEAATAAARYYDDELQKQYRETQLLRDAATRQRKYKKQLPRAPFERGMSLHFLSQRTKGKVRDKCFAFHRCLGTRKTFVTLSFINDVTDSGGVAILNKFLTALRSDFSGLHYVWVAERQPCGRIHFHMIVNKFLPVKRYNALWTLQQFNAGIIGEGITRDEILAMDDKEIAKYFNPFDVKKIKHIHGLSYYLTKYITKNENKGFGCAAWHCSRAVSRIFTKTVISRSTFSAAGSLVNSTVDKKTGEVKKQKPVQGKYHLLFYIENKPFFLPEMSELETVNRWVVDGMKIDRIPEVDDRQILKLYCN